MKLVHVTPAISEEASGPSYSVSMLCRSLKEAGSELDLLAMDWGPIKSPPDMLRTFKMGWGPKRLGRCPELGRNLKQRVRSGTVDLIHSHILWQMTSIYPAWAIRGSETKLVASPRGSLAKAAMAQGSVFKPLFWHLFQRSALAAADCLHATSHQEYEDIRRMGFRQPVCVLPNGVELPAASAADVPRKKEILYLGRLHRIKGIDHLLKGWAQVESKFEDWSLAIAGPEESYGRGVAYADEMKKLASDLSLQRVEFRGPKYGDEKLQAYREASVFVLPSHSENFGMTVAEALACATPAIVTKGAPWDGLEANDAGWWIDVGVDPLVRALGDAMSRPMNRLEEMGQAGRDYVRREFDWTNIGEKTTAAYRWLLGQADRPDCVVVD